MWGDKGSMGGSFMHCWESICVEYICCVGAGRTVWCSCGRLLAFNHRGIGEGRGKGVAQCMCYVVQP